MPHCIPVGQRMQSRIITGGFMQNQLPVTQLPVTQYPTQYWVGNAYKTNEPVFLKYETPIETEVGAVPANFFFSP